MEGLQLYLGVLLLVCSSASQEGEDIDKINSKIPKFKLIKNLIVQMDIMTLPGKEKEFFEDEELIKKKKKNIFGVLRAAVRVEQKIWDLPVPYRIDPSITYTGRRAIAAAMFEYSEKTCIRFVEKNEREIDYLNFVRGGGCWSYVGKIGGEQKISLDSGCQNKRVAIHEIMHALGFLHEQSRPDRDDYVRINYENVMDGQREQFKKAKPQYVHNLGVPYDYVSIMHYGRKAFSKNDKDTITPLINKYQQLGQSSDDGALTSHDIRQLNILYKCKDVSKPTCFPSCGNGKCVSANLCRCDYGWSGMNCDIAMCNPSCVHGNCVSYNTCRCKSGWKGTSCNTEKPLIHHCFPSDAYLRNDKGFPIAMKDLKIGDKVLTMDNTGHPIQSTISMMLHRDLNRTVDDYVTISTEDGNQISLSSYHLIPLSNSEFVFGKDVRPGQNITVYDITKKSFKMSEIVSVESVTKTGLYAPLSMEGTLIVNDVYVSCYASFPSHSISHAMFSLWRILYKNFEPLLSHSTDMDGVHWYPSIMKYVASYFNLFSL